MKGELVETYELLQVDVDSQVQPPFLDGALLQSSRSIAQHLANVGRREFNAVLLEWIGQKTESLLFDRALSRVRIGRLVVVRFLVLLRDCTGCKEQND